MFLYTISLTALEIAVLFAVAVIFGLAIHFFIVSRRSLKETLRSTGAPSPAKKPLFPKKERPAKALRPVVSETFERLSVPERPLAKAPAQVREESVDSLKETIQQQQKLLNGFLRQVEEIEQEGKEKLEMENKALLEEIQDMEDRLEKKSAEVEEARQSARMAERMAAKIEEVYQEFEALQEKMGTLEKQAARANNLALELEDTRQAYEQVHKDLQRKSDKLEEAFSENQRLQLQLHTLEDKLAEANLQRQQLQKKVQFLQDLNTDLQSVSDTNKKLQTELRRIGELESMLNMIAEERDHLLKRNKS